MSEQQVQRQSSSMDAGSIKELLDTDQFVNSLKENLGLEYEIYLACPDCGRELDGKNCPRCKDVKENFIRRKKWKERPNSLMTKQGVEMLLTTVRGSADKNQITSNFEEGQIMRIMENMHEKVADEIFQNWDSYGIRNRSMAHKIVALTTNAIWSVFNRAEGGQTLEAVADMGNDKTVMERHQRDESSGWSSRIGLGGR